jgi:DNA-binding MarR family transcriptional regulator
MGRGKPLEPSVQSCLDSMGISLLSEWDVLAFVHRHGASLASSDQIALLIGYESTVVGAALERLESEKLIERSRPSQGVRFYRILASTDAGRQRCLQQIVSLSETRAGRLLLTKQLKPDRSNRAVKNHRNKLAIESGEGKGYV